MGKRKKHGIIFAIMVFIIVFITTFILSTEVNIVYEKINENSYVIETVKQIQPFDYNTGGNIVVWFAGAFIMFISLYMAFVKAKEKDINKAQMIVLAIIFPIILFAAVGLSDISISDGAWFLIIVVLLIIAIFEYDLFGNKTIISFFNFKLLIKITILIIMVSFIIGLLGELIPPFIKTTTSPITKKQYENYIDTYNSQQGRYKSYNTKILQERYKNTYKSPRERYQR